MTGLWLNSSRRAHQQLAIFDWDRRSRFVVHAHFALFVAEAVGDVVTDHFFIRIRDRVAAPLRCRLGVVGLHVFLHFVAGIAASCCTGDGGYLLASAATDLVAQNAAYRCTR